MKNLKTLPADIYALFNDEEHHEPNPENLQELGKNLQELVSRRLARREDERSPLRFSNLGKPDRQLWFQANKPELGEKMSAKTFFKFLYGDVIEQLLLFLAKEAGHDVRNEQQEVERDGIKGHLDATIDGYVVDVKSASPFSYKKFFDGTLFENDPFGYIGQLSSYGTVVEPGKSAAFLVADKVHGDIGLAEVPAETIGKYQLSDRIEHLREVIASPEMPPRCYEDEPEGKSGNRKLGVNCSYCPFKQSCWMDSNGGRGLRTFLYYKGPVFLTEVAREPDVPEITNKEVELELDA